MSPHTVSDPGTDSRPTLPSRAVTGLSWLVAVLAGVAATAGLGWPGGSGTRPFTTLRGQVVETFGHGLYHHDTVFAGAGQRGTDAIVLALGIPLLAFSIIRYRRGSLRGRLLLCGVLVFFLYVYGSASLGTVAYNGLFLIYVAIASASLFAFVLTFRSVDPVRLGTHLSSAAPRRFAAAVMLTSGAVTLVVWTMPLVAALLTGQPPDRLDSYTTPVTTALDLAIITPSTVVAGVLLLRRDPLGYLVAVSLLVLEAMLAPLIAAQTVSQVSAGVSLSPGEIVGPLVGFLAIAAVAAGALVAILRSLRD